MRRLPLRHLAAAIATIALGLTLTSRTLAAPFDLGDTRPEGAAQQAPTATPTNSRGPENRPDNRGPEQAPGRQNSTTATGTATTTGTGTPTRGKTPPQLPPNASDRARTVVTAVFERNAAVRDLLSQLRAARGLPSANTDESVTDEFAAKAKERRSGDAVVDSKGLTTEQRDQFRTQLRAIMDAFAQTLQQSADVVGGSSGATPTATATATATATTSGQ